MLNLNNATVTQENDKFLVELERIYGEFQNLERDLLAFCQMRCEAKNISLPVPTGRRATCPTLTRWLENCWGMTSPSL